MCQTPVRDDATVRGCAGTRGRRGALGLRRRCGFRGSRAFVATLVLLGHAASAAGRTPTPSHTPVPTPEPPITAIHGRVYDAAQGVPVPGARLEYTRLPSGVEAVAFVGFDGTFEIPISQQDRLVTVHVVASGFLSASFVYFPDFPHPVDVALEPEPRQDSVVVYVSDPRFPLPAGVAGAEVVYLLFSRATQASPMTGSTDDLGYVELDVPVDVAYVVLRVNAAGFVPFLRSYDANELRRSGFVAIELEPLNASEREIAGLVYDASVGPSAPVAGATVRYQHQSRFLPSDDGVVYSDAGGRFAFAVTMAQESSVDITVEAPGFAPGLLNVGTWYRGEPLEVGLAPSGGIIQVEPYEPFFAIQCAGQVEVTIRNLGAPGDRLAVTGVSLRHGYSQGEYGAGFSWDLSALGLPAMLDGGESLTFPVAYRALPEDYDSRLHVRVRSGARDGVATIVLHGRAGGPYGSPRELSCGPPTPTPTPTAPPSAPCPGDCSGDGRVTIDELLRGVAAALGTATAPCAAFRPGTAIGIGDLISAVGAALRGCPAP